jgi:glycosyltransferase involved in cell wall biosynthesis
MRDELTSRDSLVIKIRGALSNLPKLKIVAKPIRKDGIAFLIPVKNEERWIKPCLLSIIDVADEIIVVDSSTEDKTTEIVGSLAKQHDKIKHIRFYWEGNNAIVLSRHIALMSTQSKWIFDWEADQIVKTEDLLVWVDRLKRLDKNKYYMIDLPRLNFTCDLQHLYKPSPLGYQGRIFTWSPQLRYILDQRWNRGQERLAGDSIWGQRLPPWYALLRWHEPYIYHLNIKSPKRMLERTYWENYMKNSEGYKTLEEYAKYRVSKQNMTMEQAQEKFMSGILENTVPYDKEKYGELPESLQKIVGND